MVQKKSKHGYNRGCTFCHQCRYKSIKETGKIYKFMFGNGHDDANQTEVSETLEQHLPDGGMQHNMNFGTVLETYSLNKRKRWLLPSKIIDVIDSGELDDVDFRVVMHERSSVPIRYAWYTQDSEIKASTLSYHDSKYTVHHMYPNPKSRVSSLTDLKLNCHLQHDKAKPNLRTSDTTKPSRKRHTRGVQRMRTNDPEQDIFRPWMRNEFYFRDVMEGGYHRIKEPEVRYEIHYPDVFNRYCQCKKYYGHRMYFPLDREKPLRRWKTKGCRAKPSMQEHFKGIDHLEKRFLTSDYVKEMYEDIDVYIESEITDEMYQDEKDILCERKTITVADFCGTLARPSFRKTRNFRFSKINKKTIPYDKMKSYTVNGTPIGNCYGKGCVMYIDNPEKFPREEGETLNTTVLSADDVKDDVIDHEFTKNDMVTLSSGGMDFESQFCSCAIDEKSIQDTIDNPTDFDVHVSNCAPQLLCMTIRGEPTIARVMLWQRSWWSLCSDQAEYWIKVQFESDSNVVVMASDEFKSKLSEEDDAILSLHQIATVVKREAENMYSTAKRYSNRENVLPIGYLTTSIANPSFDVKAVHEAYETLLTEEEDILKSFELINTIPSPSGIGACETCFCETYDPQADGCTLLPCQHYFCTDCWRQHIITRIKEGTVNIPCQAFECKEFIDDVMVRTLVSSDLANQWIKRKKERMLESQSWRWCPTASCDKVASVLTSGRRFTGDNIPVLCDCDSTWCFSCQSDVHWPATCDQYLNYWKTLSQNGQIDGGIHQAELRLYYVDVKKCPKCKHPIEKNGGCPQMTCRCSHSFCWECLRERSSHVDGVECQANASSLITMILDDTDYAKMHTRMYRKCVDHRYKRKKTFSNHAIQQRVKVFGCSTACKTKNSNTKQAASHSKEELTDQSAIMEFRSSLIFVREVHLVLENVFVMLSYTSRRMRPNLALLDHIEFCVFRMEHIMNSSWLCKEDLRRVSRLRSSIEGSLRILPYVTSVIQREIRAAKQRIDRPFISSVILT